MFGTPDVEKLRAREDVDGLVKALGHRRPAIRRAAARALAEMGHARLVAGVPQEAGGEGAQETLECWKSTHHAESVVRAIVSKTFLIMIFNLLAYLAIGALLGGFAFTGKSTAGGYYLGYPVRGSIIDRHYVQVSSMVYRYSEFHGYFVVINALTVFLSWMIHKRVTHISGRLTVSK